MLSWPVCLAWGALTLFSNIPKNTFFPPAAAITSIKSIKEAHNLSYEYINEGYSQRANNIAFIEKINNNTKNETFSSGHTYTNWKQKHVYLLIKIYKNL